MAFEEWLSDRLKTNEQKVAEQQREEAARKKASEDAREALLLEWCRDAYRLFKRAQDVLVRNGQHVTLSLSTTEPALSWPNGRKLELVLKDRFVVEVRRENARIVQRVTSDEVEGSGAAVLTDAKDKMVTDAESFLREFIADAAQKN